MTSLRTIDIAKLEAEIAQRDAAIAVLKPSLNSQDMYRVITYAATMAERNALVGVFNSLR